MTKNKQILLNLFIFGTTCALGGGITQRIIDKAELDAAKIIQLSLGHGQLLSCEVIVDSLMACESVDMRGFIAPKSFYEEE